MSKKKSGEAEFSKYITETAFKTGRNIIYACLFLCAFAIYKELNTAAYLTGAIAVGEGLMILVVKWYLSLATVDHTSGGITYEAAKASGFKLNMDDITPGVESPETTEDEFIREEISEQTYDSSSATI